MIVRLQISHYIEEYQMGTMIDSIGSLTIAVDPCMVNTIMIGTNLHHHGRHPSLPCGILKWHVPFDSV